MNRAPEGGMVSAVNGQRYEGGEFMPEHGLYCGLGGARIRKTELEAIKSKMDENNRIEWDEAGKCWAWYRKVTLSDGTTTWQRALSYYSAKTLKKYWMV